MHWLRARFEFQMNLSLFVMTKFAFKKFLKSLKCTKKLSSLLSIEVRLGLYHFGKRMDAFILRFENGFVRLRGKAVSKKGKVVKKGLYRGNCVIRFERSNAIEPFHVMITEGNVEGIGDHPITTENDIEATRG